MVSGERLAFLDADHVEGKSARAVKQSLAVQLGIPRFRQRLHVEDGSRQILDDEVFADAPGKVLLVLLAFAEPDGEADSLMLAACRSNNFMTLEELLQHPRDPNEEDEFGRALLSHAAATGHVQTMQLLLEAAADINSQDIYGSTPLVHALYMLQDPVEPARLLIEAGADKNQAKTDGATPLFIASQNGHFEVVSVLK